MYRGIEVKMEAERLVGVLHVCSLCDVDANHDDEAAASLDSEKKKINNSLTTWQRMRPKS